MEAGLAERHGAIIKLMFLRFIHELCLQKEWELKYGIAMVIQAKNRLMRRCGMSPIQVVQGRDEVLPSSLLSQLDKAEVKFTTNSVILEEAEQQRMSQLRQASISAFHWLDSRERLRVALNSRSRQRVCLPMHWFLAPWSTSSSSLARTNVCRTTPLVIKGQQW